MTVLDSVAPLSPFAKAQLAIEIFATYVRVRWSMWRDNLPTAVVTLTAARAPRALSPVLGDVPRDGLRLGRAVVRGTASLPSGSACLLRSLVLLRVLARRGVRGDLVIGVQLGPHPELGSHPGPGVRPPLDAHAWIEVDGEPLLNPAPDFGRLVKL